MAQKRNSFRHPRRAGSKNRIYPLVVVLLFVVAVFFVLERIKDTGDKHQPVAVPPVEKHKMTDLSGPDYSQNVYTSVKHVPETRSLPSIRAVKHGSIAIIIDDMGASMKDTNRLLAINLPITFAIIPGLAHSRSVAEAVHAKGRGVMIHIPMEPKGYPEQKLEKNGLLISQGSEEISSRVQGYLQEVPHAAGANNHMGSAFTEHEEKMLPVLDMMKQKGMFFVDSRTSSASVGYSMAVRMGMHAGTRNIFLDNDPAVDKVKTQLLEAARMAKKRGSVIAICHPHPGTIEALQEMMPQLQREGIVFVSAAQLVR